MREQGRERREDEPAQELDLDEKTVQDLEPSKESAEKIVGGVNDTERMSCSCGGGCG